MDCSGFPRRASSAARAFAMSIATIPGRSAGQASPAQRALRQHADGTRARPTTGSAWRRCWRSPRCSRQSPPPRPVTLLFNEGEEYGLNGAARLRPPRSVGAADVNSLINIDARGVSGPALMFETSEPNGAAIAAYSAGTRRPYANSISTDFAKLIPNTTDVVKFAPRGWTLLNYGIIGNETRYHSPGDNIAALDRASVAQVGSEVLGRRTHLVRHARSRTRRVGAHGLHRHCGPGLHQAPARRRGSHPGTAADCRTVPGVAQKGARPAPAARGGHAVRRKHRRRAGRVGRGTCSVPAISGAPIRSSPTSPSMPCCSRRWRRSGRFAATDCLANGCAPRPGC